MKVLELYSGIGGMHYALKVFYDIYGVPASANAAVCAMRVILPADLVMKLVNCLLRQGMPHWPNTNFCLHEHPEHTTQSGSESGINAEVVAAIDINVIANDVYKHSFPSTTLLQRNIQSISVKELDSFKPDMIMMSPPCQPFTRVGLKKDVKDARTVSFLHILNILPELLSVKYILLENVKGFETSDARKDLTTVLDNSNFTYQEFLLSPHQFFIPNVRHRYYLIAKRKPKYFCFTGNIEPINSFPLIWSENCSTKQTFQANINNHNLKYSKLCDQVDTLPENECMCFSLEHILEREKDTSEFYLCNKVLAKYALLLHIVTPQSRKTCCFTKAYGHYVEGTGSVLCDNPEDYISEVFAQSKNLPKGSNEYVCLLQSLNMRYFTPKEVSRLMCFPQDKFCFPDKISTKQKYRLLGNSINVHVVSLLIILLTHDHHD